MFPTLGSRSASIDLQSKYRRPFAGASHKKSSNAQGKYSISDLEPGSYDVTYRCSWRAYPARERIVIANGVKTQTANLMIRGQAFTAVLRSDGQPIARAVLVMRAKPKTKGSRHNGAMSRRASPTSGSLWLASVGR